MELNIDRLCLIFDVSSRGFWCKMNMKLLWREKSNVSL